MKTEAHVFTSGPFRGRAITTLSDSDLREAVETLPRGMAYIQIQGILDREQARRSIIEHEQARRQRAAEARAARDPFCSAPGSAEIRKRRRAAALSAATDKERAAYESALDTRARRAVLQKILSRLDREAAAQRREQQRRDEQARLDAYAAQRAAWLAEYAKTHPEDADDPWALNAAWRRFERTQYGPAEHASHRNGDQSAAMLEVIAAGRKALARTHHPDAGGATDAMARINHAADALERLANDGRRP
jgi:hypothetical protein